MSAYYDGYDYSAYWTGREYEHDSEVTCIKSFLNKIPKIEKALEIGGGFGRMVPAYAYRAKSVLLTDPSNQLLSLAKSKLIAFKNIRYMQSTIENLGKKKNLRNFDLIIMIRVMHHLDNPDEVFEVMEKLSTPHGYLILEFANKIHFKKLIRELFKGNFNFLNNRQTIDVRSEKSKKDKTIAFLNYHPETIKEALIRHNFDIIDTRSVSNIRSPYLKKHLPKAILTEIEKYLQKPLSYIYFGPSIFVLARKRG